MKICNDSEAKKQKRYRLAALLFVALLTLPSVTWGVLKVMDRTGMTDIRRMDDELGENRARSVFEPDIDHIGESVEAFYNDRVPYRSFFILTNRKINSKVEKPYNALIDKIYNKDTVMRSSDERCAEDVADYDGSDSGVLNSNRSDADCSASTIDDNPAKEEETVSKIGSTDGGDLSEAIQNEETEPDYDVVDENLPYFPMRIVNELTILGRDNWLFYGKDTNRNNYTGNNLPDSATLAEYARIAQAANDICAAKGKVLRIMICPDKESVYPEYYPSVKIESEYRKPQAIYDSIRNNTDVDILYPKEALLGSKDVCQLYYAYDSHWNYAGAYVGAAGLLGSLGISMPPLEAIDHPQTAAAIKDLVYIGDLDPADYKDDKDYLIDIRPGVKQTAVYDVIGTTQVMDYHSNATNDAYVVLIGDSYHEHMKNYITDNFSHFTFIHKDVMDSEYVVDYLNSADIIVLETVERNVDSVATMAERIVQSLYQ